MLNPLSTKEALKKSSLVIWLVNSYRDLLSRDYFCRHAKVENRGYGKYRKMIRGNNNKIVIGENTRLTTPMFRIIGNNNTILIGDNCFVGKNCSFWMEGNNIQIIIGNNTTFTQHNHLNAQEEGSIIRVGNNCMFSNHIIVRTSDAHPIFDMETGKRINPARNVDIGNDVWIAPDSKIMKGAEIGDGCIIGSNSMVSNSIPAHSLAVGTPAKAVKTNVRWTRDDVLFHKFE